MRNVIAEDRFHAPLRDKQEDELLWAINKGWAESVRYVAELKRRGWTERNIEQGLNTIRERAARHAAKFSY